MAQQAQGQAPPGWYPDPGGSDQQRWWDGERWTDRLQPNTQWEPAAPKKAPPTSPWAVAALALGIVGAFLLAVVVGLIAKKKIRESGGKLGGDGMATAGIALGAVWGVVGLAVLSLAGSGAFDAENGDDFSGPRRELALVVDRLEGALKSDRGSLACDRLLTPAFAARLAAGPQRTCAAAVADAVPDDYVQLDLDVRRIELRGQRATLIVEEGDDRQTWTLLRAADGRWRVDGIRR